MTKDRENELRQMSPDQQQELYHSLMDKFGAKFVAPGDVPPMYDARELAAADEERDLLEQLLRESE